MKRVLIALDYDTTAIRVAEAGYSVAKAMKADTYLLHVIAEEFYYSSLGYSPITGFAGFSNEYFSNMANTEGLAEASQYFLNSTKEHLGDNSIKTITHKGEFAEVIIKTAGEIEADLLVMGSHSRRWLDQILMGSVTEEVLHKTTLPLLIIPTRGTGSK